MGKCVCENKCSLGTECPRVPCYKDIECDSSTGECPELSAENYVDPGTKCALSDEQKQMVEASEAESANYECHEGRCVFMDPCADKDCRGPGNYEGTCLLESTCDKETGLCLPPKN